MEPFLSAHSPEFLNAARAAIAAAGETLVLIRWAGMGGAKDWHLLHAPEELDNIVRKASAKTSVSVFLKPELPVRGRVDKNLKAAAHVLLADLKELLVSEFPTNGSELNSAAFDNDTELDQWLDQREGLAVAIGRYPPFWLDDGPEQLSAYVPDFDGVVRPGAY
jgi:hypothetical protein